MKILLRLHYFLFLVLLAGPLQAGIIFCGSPQNDLYLLLVRQHYTVKRFDRLSPAIAAAAKGDALFIVADGYPGARTPVTAELIARAESKNLKLFLEYPSMLPGEALATPINTQLERGVVTSEAFGPALPPMSILGINDCRLLPIRADNPLIILAKVAGFDKAAYGVDDVTKYPLLFQTGNMLVSTTKLSNFTTGRYGPNNAWQSVWAYILKWMTGRPEIHFTNWPSDVSPMYAKDARLPANAALTSVKKGVEWMYKARFFVNPVWKDSVLKYQEGANPVGPPLNPALPNGDGHSGLLEGHTSKIYYNGRQQYRYWLRADVQGEAAFALSWAGKLLKKKQYNNSAANLIDYIFSNSNLRSGPRKSPNSASYGLLGWTVTNPDVFYGDDNARALLGIAGASANMHTGKWDKELVEGILANFRTSGKHGFRGNHLDEKDLLKWGWKYFSEREIINPAPHYESWIWALYLWLYQKTGYKPLLDKTETAIRITMQLYPDKWKWANGIQQERARMILPLAWLVRIKDNEEHRHWLDMVVQKLLENQVASGAIREELGTGQGRYGRTASNKEYGLHEAPLIFTNGDPVADMLYTSNFAFFSLNEAAAATGNRQYAEAVNKLSDFLTRIQVRSTKHADLDGAWFRAFEYQRWEYWGSNADVGWGAWSTLTGWTQSWIVATQSMVIQHQNFWDLTKQSGVKKYFDVAASRMLEEKAPLQ